MPKITQSLTINGSGQTNFIVDGTNIVGSLSDQTQPFIIENSGTIASFNNLTVRNGKSGYGGVNSNTIAVNVRNTIIAGNFGAGPDFMGTFNSLGYNLIGNTSGTTINGDTTGNILNTNAKLSPLGSYGGVTQMHALLPDSPAINAGNPVYDSAVSGTTDQRGSQRLIGGTIDIGAFEANVTFNQATLPNGDTSLSYSQQLSASRQTSFVENEIVTETQNLAPTNFEIEPLAGQSLPSGITLSLSGLLSGMPTITGNYTFMVKATDTDGIAGVKQYSMQVFAPTAASVSISGRISAANGNGIRNVMITLTDSNGNTRTTRSSTFGYYQFDNVEVGETYVISVSSKRFSFIQPSQIISVNDELTNIDFVAQE